MKFKKTILINSITLKFFGHDSVYITNGDTTISGSAVVLAHESQLNHRTDELPKGEAYEVPFAIQLPDHDLPSSYSKVRAPSCGAWKCLYLKVT